ncbi:AMIN-like domain-containing (lipo)protein [Actinokineospora enzanensis]|uniref:AMIN-like domain-containing (lipo)protein n=1 Tax=Actinokineospora enzanensis TaxID=155975 RepID=UPI0003684BE7|nr:hypothetical protein [Actinokineospora enzanensis]
MRAFMKIVLAVTTAATLTVALPTAAPAAVTACESGWGSLTKTAAPSTAGPVTNIRSGRQDCYDRLVIDLSGTATQGYYVQYVPEVTMDGSGKPVPLRGGAFLQIVVYSPAYDDNGNLTYHPANWTELVDVTGYQTFRQASWAGSFEGTTTVGLGVRARLPFRVFTLTGPSRVVIDVAHSW